MEANELTSRDLMVGDWLKHYNGTPVQVTKITTEHFACAENGGVNCWEYNNKYEPIPLTPEILKKNGFELDDIIKDYRLYTGIDNRVTAHNDKEYMNSNNEWYVHVDSEDFCSIANCELTYLHELQHLLKLVKIDFEFNV